MKHNDKLGRLERKAEARPEQFDLAALDINLNIITTDPTAPDGYRTTHTMRLGIDSEPQPVEGVRDE